MQVPPAESPRAPVGDLKGTRVSLVDSIQLVPGDRIAMPPTDTNDRVHRLSRPDDQTDPGDCSTLLRRVSGPVADELYFLCRPECGTTDVAAQAKSCGDEGLRNVNRARYDRALSMYQRMLALYRAARGPAAWAITVCCCLRRSGCAVCHEAKSCTMSLPKASGEPPHRRLRSPPGWVDQ